jgi:nanoRNase/pAp phosphatase (c-di-AMP/oligoRNAs hydrolase)
MDKAAYEQITNLLEKSQKILILTHARADCDGLGAALAGYLVFKEMGKEVTVATNDPAQENLQFLPAIDILQNSLAASADFIITLDAKDTPIGKIKYNVEDHKVNIIITPKEGHFAEESVSFGRGKAKFDLIFVLDSGNLDHLGPLYDQNVEMFYETPIINIDHHASNTDFGQVNLVNSTAASTTEILYEYLVYLEKKMDKKLITDDVATLLLAGIITDTGSFQHANTSPRSMETASKLLDLGARQQEIIKNIYKTKKLSTLKLWGIILAKVQVDPVYRIVWSAIGKEDLQEADADSSETEGIIDDLLTNAPGAEVIFLVKQNDDYVSVSMRSTSSQIDVGKFCADQGGGGHARAAGFKVRDGRPFDQIVSDVVAKVRKFQTDRLNIHPENLMQKPEPVLKTPSDTAQPEGSAAEAQHVALPEEKEKGERPAEKAKEEKKMEKTTYLDFKTPKSKKEKRKEEKPAPETPDDTAATQGDAAGAGDLLPADEGMAEKSIPEEPKSAQPVTSFMPSVSEKSDIPPTDDVPKKPKKRRSRRRRPRPKQNAPESPASDTGPKAAPPPPPPLV